MPNAASFGAAGDQQRDGRGRTVINVGHPHVERRGAELEREAGNDEDQAEDEHALVGLALADDFEDARNVEAAGGAVHHRQAVEQEARRQRAEHEVLHRRLGAGAMVAPQGHQRIERQAHQLQAEIDDEEVVGRDHDAHAEQREQRQREELALQHLARADVRTRIGDGDHHRYRGEERQQVAERVGDNHALHRIDRLRAVQPHQVQQGHSSERGLREPERRSALLVFNEEIDQRDHAGHRQQDDLGGDGGPVHSFV